MRIRIMHHEISRTKNLHSYKVKNKVARFTYCIQAHPANSGVTSYGHWARASSTFCNIMDTHKLPNYNYACKNTKNNNLL